MSVTERRPICPSCHQPLCGELVASCCNHVFHRGCLAAALGAKKPCAKCGEDLRPQLRPGLSVKVCGLQFGGGLNGRPAICEGFNEEAGRWVVRVEINDGSYRLVSLLPDHLEVKDPLQACLNLYGVNFGEGLEGGIAAFTEKMAEEDSAAAVARAERLREVAALITKKNNVRKMKELLAQRRESLQEAKEVFARQAEKHDGCAKILAKKKEERRKAERDAKQEEDVRTSLAKKIDLARQRDTANDYWEMIKSGQDAQALKYLTTMVGLAAVPARILVEVSRLRSHVNDTLTRERKEASAASRKFQEVQRQLQEIQAEERRAALKDRPRDALQPAAKQARI